MVNLFFQVVDLSVTASYVILAILVLRLCLRKAPKRCSYLLWAAAGFRLACPVSFESALSFINLGQLLERKTTAVQNYVNQTSVQSPAVQRIPLPISELPAESQMPTEAARFSLNQNTLFTAIWIAGMAALAAYSLVSYFRLRRQMRTAIRDEGNVWLSDRVRSPFILGCIQPRIYLPFGLNSEEKEYVLAHERHHLRRGDHFVKLLAFALLAVHWFNPLVWVAFTLMSQDMEMSCDEAVLGRHENIRKSYSMTLLSFASNRRFSHPSPLAFSESDVKPRIKNALSWKKPALWINVMAAALCIVLTACFVADPVAEAAEDPKEEAVETFYDHTCFTGGAVIAESPILSSHWEDGSFLKTIFFNQGPLAVFSEDIYLDEETGYLVNVQRGLPSEEATLFRDPMDFTHTIVELTREELIRGFEDQFLTFYQNGQSATAEEVVPRGSFRAYYCYDTSAAGTDVAFTIYECDGQPLWIAQGICTRIIELVPKDSTMDWTTASFEYEVDENGTIIGIGSTEPLEVVETEPTSSDVPQETGAATEPASFDPEREAPERAIAQADSQSAIVVIGKENGTVLGFSSVPAHLAQRKD